MKLLFITPDDSGSAFYRILQPANKLEQHLLATTGIVRHKGEESQQVYNAMASSDVIIMSRAGSPRLTHIFGAMRRGGKKIVMDLDDDLFNLSIYSPHYQHLGTHEASHMEPDGTIIPIWVDGKNINLKHNKTWLEDFKQTLRSVDLITVSTEYLAKLYGEFGPTQVIPYYIDLDLWKPVKVKWPDQYLRLGWRGGQSHYEDLKSIEEPLVNLMKRHENLKLVMVGWCPKSWRSLFPRERLEVHDFIDNVNFPWRMMGLGIDIAFYPWAEIEFNKGKTITPWLEWSAMGVPGVYPAMDPFTNVIRHKDNGLVASSSEGWYEAINKLIKEPETRAKLGATARRDIEKHWDINKNIKQYQEVYEWLITRSGTQTAPQENSVTVLH